MDKDSMDTSPGLERVNPDWKDTNPKDGAATTRLDLSLFPDTAIAYGALAMTEGDLKYGGYNFREAGVKVSVYQAALKRHWAKFWNGEWADPKTKVPHLASVEACCAILIDAYECGKVIDDRPPRVDMGGLLDRFQEIVAHLQDIFPESPGRFTHEQTTQKKGPGQEQSTIPSAETEATLDHVA